MPGEDLYSWSITAADNGTADTSINWAEGQPRASVNNSARSMMATHAKDRNLTNGSIVTTGTANAQAFSSGVGYTATPTNRRILLKIGTGLNNTGPATLNMDSIGAVPIKTQTGNDPLAGALKEGVYTEFLFNGTNWIVNPATGAIVISGVDVGGGGGGGSGGGGGGIDVGDGGPGGPGHVGGGTWLTSGSYIPSPSMIFATIECVGGGGGGGSTSSSTTLIVGGGGGGSGGYSRKHVRKVDIGVSQVVTIGAAGAAGVSQGSGGAGGDTSVGTLCIAKGGGGGSGSILGGSIGGGGAGGIAGTGDVIAAGSPGQYGGYSDTQPAATFSPGGGAGGSSFFGGGALGTAATYGSTQAGRAAANYGSGGSGSVSHGGGAFQSGGAGSVGLVIITEFVT